MLPKSTSEKSSCRKELIIMHGEQTYMSTADIVERCSAAAFFNLQRMNPGTMYASVKSTFCRAIKNIEHLGALNYFYAFSFK
jgi:hypothetical protein